MRFSVVSINCSATHKTPLKMNDFRGILTIRGGLMAEKQKYWIKLEKDFLNSSQIKVIKNMPNGKDYIIFYLALMLESTNTEGHLRFSELVPYNEGMLASITDTNVDIVRTAIKIFQNLGLIQILTDGTIFLPDVPKRVGKECESAERVRLYRERHKLLQCNADVTECNDNKDKEKDKDIDKESSFNNKSSLILSQGATENPEETAKFDKNSYIYELFEKIWQVYPVKVSKEQAKKTWLKKLNKLNTKEQIYIKAKKIAMLLENHKKSWGNEVDKQGNEGRPKQFIPHFSSWLNNEIPDKD